MGVSGEDWTEKRRRGTIEELKTSTVIAPFPILHHKKEVAKFNQPLAEALEAIRPNYFEIKVQMVKGIRKKICERMFSYELYHQLRLKLRDIDPWQLSPELSKRGNDIMNTSKIPDLLLHQPGNKKRNLYVIEIKSITGSLAGFKKDSETLKHFIDNKYVQGFFIIFGKRPYKRTKDDGMSRLKTKFNKLPNFHHNKITILWLKEPKKLETITI